MIRKVLLIVLLLALMSMPVLAQEDIPLISPASNEVTNPDASILWPPPVYVLRGEFSVRGSANLADMTNYFLEFRPIDENNDDEEEWIPVSLPSNAAVQDDVLAVWDTLLAPDGLYELRMTVNRAGGDPVISLVRPLRIENTPSPFAATATPTFTPVPPTQAATATPTNTITPTVNPNPTVTIAVANANVRQGDSTLYPIVSSYPQGTQMTIVAVSANNTGWYLIELPQGGRAWVAPSVVTVSGNVATLPRISPPPPPVTPTPIPTATPIATATPITSANLVAGVVSLTPGQPICNQTVTIGFDVANLGTTATSASGTISVTDVRASDGTVSATTVGGFPVLQPGQTFRAIIPLTVTTFFDENHRITLVIDPGNQIPETVEGDNTQTITYTLAKGGC